MPRRFSLAFVLCTTALPAFAETCEDRGTDYAKRIALCDQAFEAATDADAAAFALSLKGEAQRMLGDFAGAVETLQSALRYTPANVWVWVELGNTHYDQSDIAAALAHYSAALAVEDYPYAWANRAETWWDFSLPQSCSDDADQALRLDPQYAFANEIKGRCLIDLGRADQALSYFDTAIALLPDYQNAYRNKMAALAALGRHEEVVAVADLALLPATVPTPNAAIEEDILSRRLLALARYAPPETVAAEAEALLARFPQSFAAVNVKGRVLISQTNWTEADKITQPLRLNPEGRAMVAEYHDTLAQIDVALGRLEDAYTQYGAALDLAPDMSRAYARKLSGLGFLPLSNAPAGVMTALRRCLDVKKTACLISG